MSSTPFFPMYVADYLADTSHLTTEQHGAYMLLLLSAWPRGGRLPADMKKLARIARVSPRRWHLVADEVLDFFEIDEGEIVSRRLEREYKKAISKSEKRIAAGRRGGTAKALKDRQAALANAKAMPCHSPEPEPEDTCVSNLLSDLPQDDASKPTRQKPEKRFGVRVDHPAWSAWNAWPKTGRARSSIKDTVAAYERMDVTHDELMAAIAAYLRTQDGRENPKGLHRWVNDQRFMPFLEAGASVTAIPVEPVTLSSSPEDAFLGECRKDGASEVQIRRFRGRFTVERFGEIEACVTDEGQFEVQFRGTIRRLGMSIYAEAFAAKRRSA